jgi:hypothetical protein
MISCNSTGTANVTLTTTRHLSKISNKTYLKSYAPAVSPTCLRTVSTALRQRATITFSSSPNLPFAFTIKQLFMTKDKKEPTEPTKTFANLLISSSIATPQAT